MRAIKTMTYRLERAGIEEPMVIERVLTHLGLAAQPPPRAPARRVDLLQAA